MITTLNDLGTTIQLVAFFLNLWAVVTYLLGIVRQDDRLQASGKGSSLALAITLTLSMAVLWIQFLSNDFSNAYVHGHSSTGLATVYKISALWAGNEGSMLLWAWVLAIFTAIIAYGRHRQGQEFVPWVMVVLLLNNLFFTLIMLVVKNPFAVLDPAPVEGQGLNPLLQDPGMILHPTTLYIGYVGFAIPYAYAIAALILNRADDVWIRATRRWTLFAWLFLSIGIIFGGQWAYVVLGWGGYWAWDPVENASLLPWLTGTAFLHSVMIQERRGMLKVWNLGLIIGTFVLTLLGTYLVRGGVLQSVHAFSDSSLGIWFFGFMAVVIAASVAISVARSHLLREENQFEGLISKESSFLLNNLLLVGAAFTVFWGTMFPLISEAVRGVKVTVGPPFYNKVITPIGLLLILLVGICPLVPWKKASWRQLVQNFLYPLAAAAAGSVLLVLLGMRHYLAVLGLAVCIFVVATVGLELYRGVRARRKMAREPVLTAFWRLTNRNRRRYGGYIIHLSVIMIVVGVIGSFSFEQEKMYTVKPGQTMTIKDYALTYPGLASEWQGAVEIVYSDLVVSQRGRELGLLRSQKEFHPTSEQPTTRVGILGGFVEDLYVILNGWEADGTASFKVLVNPLVTWVWFGWYLMTAGTIFTAWPERRALERRAAVQTAPALAD